MYTVYKHLDNEENIIYIGKSKSLLHRQRQHVKNAEWFDDIDSIEYCVLDSKIEMDIIELYLINTINPKYNKKDKRRDTVENVNINELNWLEFDMNEIHTVEKIINHKKYNHDDFIGSNIKIGMLVGLIYETKVLYEIHGINKKLKLVKNDTFEKVFKFSDILIYKLDEDGQDFIFNCIYSTDNEHLIKNHIGINKTVCYGGGGASTRIGMTKVKSNQEIYYDSLNWDK